MYLVGTIDGWPDGTDPLWIDDPQAALEGLAGRDEDEPLTLVLGPDVLHKDNVSGGAPYDRDSGCGERCDRARGARR